MNAHALPAIRPLSDLRTSIGEITSFVDSGKAPVVLTKHGRGKYVLLGVEEYDDLVTQKTVLAESDLPGNYPLVTSIDDLHEKIVAGIYDIEEGRTTPAGEVIQELRATYGL